MFTVVVVLVGSGNSSTRRPFGMSYSVIPSTDAPRIVPGGSWGSAACASENDPAKQSANPKIKGRIFKAEAPAKVLSLVSSCNPGAGSALPDTHYQSLQSPSGSAPPDTAL